MVLYTFDRRNGYYYYARFYALVLLFYILVVLLIEGIYKLLIDWKVLVPCELWVKVKVTLSGILTAVIVAFLR